MALGGGISSRPVSGIYLYCIVRGSRKPSLARVPGGLGGGTSPELLPLSSSMWLVVAEVPLDTYGAGQLEPRLADLEWVGQVALAHEAVVEYFARKPRLAVIPMKLFTMFSSRERALADVGANQGGITSMMRRIAGAQEWGIRVTQTSDGARSRVSQTHPASGAAFLAAKKQVRDSAQQAKAKAADSALAAYRKLARLARESRLRNDAPASAARRPLLDAAFLVPSTARLRFTQAAKRQAAACAKAGAQMVVSGPWPAYNFVDRRDRTDEAS